MHARGTVPSYDAGGSVLGPSGFLGPHFLFLFFSIYPVQYTV